jgi:peptidoglycan/LPS O-acetylase OafA/YrhL
MSNANLLAEDSKPEVAMANFWVLPQDLSAYLDFLRFIAALAVLLGHMDQDGFQTASWFPLAYLKHEAVVVFFVMSGFIIYSSTMSRNHSWQQYYLARCGRIYSVAIPAILFSLWVSTLVPHLIDDQQIIQKLYQPFDWWTMSSSLLFLNQSWSNTADLLVNGPYWSLCYEVWYYIFFGAYIFCPKPIRWFLLLLAALIAGPAILVLFPIWLMGAWLASKMSTLKPPSSNGAWIIFVGSFSFIMVVRWFDIDVAIRQFLHQIIPGFWRLNASQRLVTDHLVGIAILLNIYSFGGLNVRVKELFSRSSKTLGFLAGFSFTLYLFHRPIIQVAGRMFPNINASIAYSASWVIAILICCYLISWLTERQTNRWRQLFAALLPSRLSSSVRNAL